MKLWAKWVVLLVALASQVLQDAQAGGAAPARSLLDACEAAKEFKSTRVSYSEDAALSSRTRWSRKEWVQLFPKRLVYAIPKMDLQLYERTLPVPAGFSPEEDTAFLLGRVTLPLQSRCGLLMLEDGYYSSTRIVLYPISSDGKAMVGLELADFFSDENEHIEVWSELQKGRSFLIRTTLRKSSTSGAGSGRATSVRTTQLWEFEQRAGFRRLR